MLPLWGSTFVMITLKKSMRSKLTLFLLLAVLVICASCRKQKQSCAAYDRVEVAK